MIYINSNTTKLNTKFFINQYGIFYEGQVLERYCCERGHFYYVEDIKIEKFVVHYKVGRNPNLYFRMSNFRTKAIDTISVNQLGTYYKIKK